MTAPDSHQSPCRMSTCPPLTCTARTAFGRSMGHVIHTLSRPPVSVHLIRMSPPGPAFKFAVSCSLRYRQWPPVRLLFPVRQLGPRQRMKQVSAIHVLVLTVFAGSIVMSWTNHSDNDNWNPVGYLRVERSSPHHVVPLVPAELHP